MSWTKRKYHIYPKYLDTSTPYHTCSIIWTSTIYYIPDVVSKKIAGWVANSVHPEKMPRSWLSHLGLHCLLKPVCPNTYGQYDNLTSHMNIKGVHMNLYHSLGQFSKRQTDYIVLIFPGKEGFDISCKNLFSGKKNKKNIWICRLLKILPRDLKR